MTPRLTEHYTPGLLVSTGFGLFSAYHLDDAGIVTDTGPRRLLGGVGMLAVVVGGSSMPWTC